MQDLIIFQFDVGEPSCPIWQELVLVDRSELNYDELKDLFESYLESDFSMNKGFEEMIKDVMDAIGSPWRMYTRGSKVRSSCIIYL